jgi:hypothetical protein
MVWASRHFEKANPQNLLRPSDLMRILVPWRAYGDLEVARTLVPEHEAVLITREKAERDRRLQDIEDAYAPLLAGLTDMEAELVALEASPYAVWKASPNETHPFFGSLLGLVGGDKEAVRRATTAAKKAYADRIRELKRRIKELGKLQAERDHQDKRSPTSLTERSNTSVRRPLTCCGSVRILVKLVDSNFPHVNLLCLVLDPRRASCHRVKLTPGHRRSTSPSTCSADCRYWAASRTTTRSPLDSRAPPRKAADHSHIHVFGGGAGSR